MFIGTKYVISLLKYVEFGLVLDFEKFIKEKLDY
jgi:hypothetical protein